MKFKWKQHVSYTCYGVHLFLISVSSYLQEHPAAVKLYERQINPRPFFQHRDGHISPMNVRFALETNKQFLWVCFKNEDNNLRESTQV